MVDATILANYLKSSGLKYKTGASSYVFVCPLCNKKDKLYIRKRDGLFICFHCRDTERFYGRCEFALAKLLNISVQEVTNHLYGTENFTFTEKIKLKFNNAPFDDYVNESLKEEDFIDNNDLIEVVWGPDCVDLDNPAGVMGLNYLQSRGVDLSLATKYQIKYQPSTRRVIFPVIVNNNLLGWQGRLIVDSDNEPKILSSKGLAGAKYLMFQDNLNTASHVVLTEGPFDAIKCHNLGGNVATMGKGVTVKKLQTIVDYGIKKVYVGLDPDAPEAVEFVCKELLKLDPEIQLWRLLPPSDKKDLGDCSLSEVEEQFKQAEQIRFPKLFLSLRNYS